MSSIKPDDSSSLRIAFIGRLTGPKGKLAERLITEVFPHFPTIAFTVAGGPLTAKWRALAGPNVTLAGWLENVTDFAEQMDLVIASGRTAIEVMHAGTPLLAAGEARYVGFVTRDRFAEAQRTNFGDCEHGADMDFTAIVRDLARFHAGYRFDTACYPDLLADYSGVRVAAAIEQVYDAARMERRLGRRALPILCYHRVVPEAPANSKINIHVTRDALARQLAQLRRRGMTPITFADLLGSEPLPRRPVILTFDDGYRDNHECLLPLLEEYDARAVIFVLGDRDLRTNVWDSEYGAPPVPLMSDAEVRDCHASGRIEIGSHGLTHCNLLELSAEALEHELAASKSALETLIDAPVRAFAYPYGYWSARERDAVARAGYTFGITTDHGTPFIHDRYAIARRIVFPNTSNFGFYKKTSRWYPRYRRLLGRPA